MLVQAPQHLTGLHLLSWGFLGTWGESSICGWDCVVWLYVSTQSVRVLSPGNNTNRKTKTIYIWRGHLYIKYLGHTTRYVFTCVLPGSRQSRQELVCKSATLSLHLPGMFYTSLPKFDNRCPLLRGTTWNKLGNGNTLGTHTLSNVLWVRSNACTQIQFEHCNLHTDLNSDLKTENCTSTWIPKPIYHPVVPSIRIRSYYREFNFTLF
jgi:hypothetical protein